MPIFSAALLLFLVMDPFGNVPLFLSVLNPIAPERRRRVMVRELLFALAALVLFLFLMSSDPTRWFDWLTAVFLAWAMTAVVLLFSSSLARLIKRRGLIAIERLMGMVLTAIAIKMILTGIGHFFGIEH